MRASLFVIFAMLVGVGAHSQECPRDDPNDASVDSISRTLRGRVVFHDDLRQWFSLELDAPVCGERTVQLVNDDQTQHSEQFRGCRVTTTGTLGVPETAYYSAELYQMVTSIEPDAQCVRQAAFPDYSKAKPAHGIRNYQISFSFDYYGPQGPLRGKVTSGGKFLTPWQAYARYSFNGALSLTAGCAKGFSMRHWRATPEAKPWTMDGQVYLDPEWAAEKHVRHIQLSFTCRR